MLVSLKEVKTSKELKQFIRFPFKLYKGVPEYVPPIIDFELSTLSKDRNPAFDTCEARYWLAIKGDEVVGRIAGIIHGQEANEKKIVRFGWIDFIDDLEVSSTLINTVTRWAKEKGLVSIHGPLGFTDLDFQGALIDGYDQLATQAGIYNFPYYKDHFEKLGFVKAVDWVEIRIKVPEVLPIDAEKAMLISEKFGISIKKFKSTKELLKYGGQVFELMNESYRNLYGYYPLSQKQIDYYIKLYFGFIRKEFVAMVTNEEDEVVGFTISLPSLSKAFQKSKGSLYPFGFVHVLKSFYINNVVDFFLIAAKPGYQRRGVHALIFTELFRAYQKSGIKEVHSGQMLEENKNVLNLLSKYESVNEGELRRRCFIKTI